MSRITRAERVPVYPAPTLVVGVGRLGLAVLERLGEDWHGLSLAGGDSSLANLRLIHVRPEGAGSEEAESAWCSAERRTAAIAQRVGRSDLPSLVLDFVILRSLGLVRYRDGSYQVAVPKDMGWVEKERLGDDTVGERPGSPEAEDRPPEPRDAGAEEVAGEGLPEPQGERRRYFDWRDLDADPVVAAERLKRVADRSTDLDLFITPILSRVRQGHSPGAVLGCIRRLAALSEGRDPSPWPWLRGLLRKVRDGGAGEWEHDGNDLRVVVRTAEEARELLGRPRTSRAGGASQPPAGGSEGDYLGPQLQGFAPPPLPGWEAWLRVHGGGCVAGGTEEGAEEAGGGPSLRLQIPGPFQPETVDPVTSLRPNELLEVDWENTGWATEGFDRGSSVWFQPAEASPFRLGLFDHDGTVGPRRERTEALSHRLRKLAPLLDQGLVRLWVDLQRERVEERSPVLDDRRREHDEAAVRQCLEILGELLIGSPETGDGGQEDEDGRDRRSTGSEWEAPSRDPERSPSRPSEFLAQLKLPRRRRPGPEACLERRLRELGLGGGGEERERSLLRSVELAPEDLEDDRDGGGGIRGLDRLASVLNREVRDLFDLDHLSSYRTEPTRRPPRLTVILVGDMGELFVRAAMRPLLREAHSELLRSFNPFLEFFRESFDRGLSVLPILWMPHPADPFEGLGMGGERGEEAAIIDAVHGIRRWVESVIPPQRRRVSQIFVNSRVTDASVLRPREAVRQTRDFLSLLLRNEVGRDDWLRTTAEGATGDDFFSCFSCYEIDFPAERSREYLANRLARDCLVSLRRPEPLPAELTGDEELALFDPPELSEPVAEALNRIRERVEEPAERLGRRVAERMEVDRSTTEEEVRTCFGPSFEVQLLEGVQEEWRRLSRDYGLMDDLATDLRRETARVLDQRVVEVRRGSDRLMEQHAAQGGLHRALAAFSRLRDRARAVLEEHEGRRRRREDLARRHRIPDPTLMARDREGILDAARDKPEQTPQRLGLALWALMAPVLGGSLASGVARAFDLPRWLELVLGPWGMVSGGLITSAAVWWLLRRHMDRAVERVRGAIASLEETLRRIIRGAGGHPEAEPSPSLRSYLESRVLLTEGLTARGFSLRIFERMEADGVLAERLQRSVATQLRHLTRRAEDLGARPRLADGSPEARRDDLSALFASRGNTSVDQLIAPERLEEVYRKRTATGVRGRVPSFLQEVGGLGDWRETACLSDAEALLAVGRRDFSDLIEVPLPDHHLFEDEVGERLCRFVARLFPNLGFGAKFAGYEGLDPDGVQVQADAALVLHPALARVYQATRRRALAGRSGDSRGHPLPRLTSTLDVIQADLRPNAAYMLSLAQGIRAHSVRNLRRFESFHGRSHLPHDRLFPVTGEHSPGTLNQLSGYRELGAELRRRLERARGPDPRPRPVPVEEEDR